MVGLLGTHRMSSPWHLALCPSRMFRLHMETPGGLHSNYRKDSFFTLETESSPLGGRGGVLGSWA